MSPARAALASALALALGCRNVVVPEPVDAGSPGACVAGFADCNGDPADGCETSLQTDGAHCGACDRSCLGQACSAGLCDPVVLAEPVYFGRRLALDPVNLYWTSADGTVRRMPLAGGPTTEIAAGQDDLFDIAVDAQGVYWTEGNGGAVRSLLFGAQVPMDLAQEGTVFALAVRDGTVFFTQIYSKLSGDEHVLRVPAAGGPVVTVATTPGALFLALDDQSAYWTDENSYAVWKAPLTGGPPVQLAAGLIAPSDIVVDGATVYFNSFEGTFAMGLDGGPTTPLARGSAHGLAVDATYVYAGAYDGRILKIPRAGGPAVTLARADSYPNALAVDEARVYWLEGTEAGALLGVPK
jgi:hypothetical protein